MLATVNSEANDDHVSVVKVIALENRFPGPNELWEGFQPKLYHSTVALLWKLSPWSSDRILIHLAQLVSCLAGIATLVLVHRLLEKWRTPDNVRVLALGLVALNPKLIGLSAQATNDAFVILFVTLVLYWAYVFLDDGSVRAFVLMATFAVCATLSKGTGLIAFGSTVVILALVLGRSDNAERTSRRTLATWAAAYIVGFVLLVGLLGPYRANYNASGGNPFAINVPADPLPSFAQSTYYHRPGITSVMDGYLTFRLLNMIENPVITNEVRPYPQHRTSLWSQLYGRTNFVHFDQWPPTWADTSTVVLTVGPVDTRPGPSAQCALAPWHTRRMQAHCPDNSRGWPHQFGPARDDALHVHCCRLCDVLSSLHRTVP